MRWPRRLSTSSRVRRCFSIRTRPSSSASTSPPIRRRSVPDAPPCQTSDRCFPRRSPRRPRTATTRCVEFTNALAHRLGVVAAETGATDVTAAVPITTGPKHRSRPQSRPQRAAAPPARRRPALVVTVVLALLLIAVGSIGLLLLRAERQTAGAQKPKPPTNSAPATAAAPVVPVVLVGADCATLGAAGVTSDGAQAYCSRLPRRATRCGPCTPRCPPRLAQPRAPPMCPTRKASRSRLRCASRRPIRPACNAAKTFGGATSPGPREAAVTSLRTVTA